ncbi:MAG: hypothetical protein JSV21_01230 [Nitrospirota bacterium]|nr:MAG: hypothetical protein JSV21_01230 [Nitrospirota bacterium]
MTDERKKVLNVGRKIGALLGAIVFAVFGIVPGFYFGSYGTLVLLSHLAGGTVEPGIIVRMILVVGTLVGIFCIGAVSIVVGSVLGTAMAYVTDLFRMPAKAVEKEATVKSN